MLERRHVRSSTTRAVSSDSSLRRLYGYFGLQTARVKHTSADFCKRLLLSGARTRGKKSRHVTASWRTKTWPLLQICGDVHFKRGKAKQRLVPACRCSDVHCLRCGRVWDTRERCGPLCAHHLAVQYIGTFALHKSRFGLRTVSHSRVQSVGSAVTSECKSMWR